MANKNEPNLAADAYARPLLELANEQGKTNEIAEELSQLAEIVRQNKTFSLYLADPGVGSEERRSTLGRVFGGRVLPLLSNFIGVLNKRSKLGLIPAIADSFHRQLEVQRGNIEVDVTTAQTLSAEELETVRLKVGIALGKNAIVHQHVDESILGGLVVRVEDKLIDASVRYQLQAMKEQLLAAAPR